MEVLIGSGDQKLLNGRVHDRRIADSGMLVLRLIGDKPGMTFSSLDNEIRMYKELEWLARDLNGTHRVLGFLKQNGYIRGGSTMGEAFRLNDRGRAALHEVEHMQLM